MRKRALPIEYISVRLECAGLSEPAEFDFISDLHLRNRNDLDEFAQAFSRLKHDRLMMGGDYVESTDLIKPFVDILNSSGKEVLGVFGNNDLFAQEHFLDFAAPNVKFIEDELVEWDDISVFGVSFRKDYHERSITLPPAASPPVILAHTPDALLGLSPQRSFTLLAGHVHGGQIRSSLWKRWWTHTRIGRAHGDGISRRDRNIVFTGRGIGCSMIELRNVSRELYEVRLVPANSRKEKA